jgi:DNA-binding transcriptional regulator YiaG
VEICGDNRTLAVLLNVTVDQVASWADGRKALPVHIYPRVVEILLEHELERLRSRMPKDRHSDLVQRAIDRCGGKKRLAYILNVSVDEITSWAEGQTQAPEAILLRILIILQSDSADASD